MSHVCLYYTVLSVPYSLVITCLGKIDLVCDVFVFCHFPIWCLGSGVVIDCIDSLSLPSPLLLYPIYNSKINVRKWMHLIL